MEENKSQQNSTGENLKTIHTYTSDMADAVRENEATVIKIALAEKDKREQEDMYKKAQGTGISKFFLTLGGIILLVGASILVYFLMQRNGAINAPVKAPTAVPAIISYDDQSFVDLSNATSASDVTEAINLEVEKGGALGSIKSLLLTKFAEGKAQLFPFDDFLSLTKIAPPQTLVRTLSGEYMVGIYTSESSRAHLFMVVQVKDFNQAYAALLEWEKTMLDDLFILFHIDVSGDHSSLFEKPWNDIIINNKDARILYDESGDDVLYYVFADKNNLIIADNQDAIEEITARLLVKNTKPL